MKIDIIGNEGKMGGKGQRGGAGRGPRNRRRVIGEWIKKWRIEGIYLRISDRFGRIRGRSEYYNIDFLELKIE